MIDHSPCATLESAWSSIVASTGRAPTRITVGQRFKDAFVDECKALTPIVNGEPLGGDPGVNPRCFFKGVELQVHARDDMFVEMHGTDGAKQ